LQKPRNISSTSVISDDRLHVQDTACRPFYVDTSAFESCDDAIVSEPHDGASEDKIVELLNCKLEESNSIA